MKKLHESFRSRRRVLLGAALLLIAALAVATDYTDTANDNVIRFLLQGTPRVRINQSAVTVLTGNNGGTVDPQLNLLDANTGMVRNSDNFVLFNKVHSQKRAHFTAQADGSAAMYSYQNTSYTDWSSVAAENNGNASLNAADDGGRVIAQSNGDVVIYLGE